MLSWLIATALAGPADVEAAIDALAEGRASVAFEKLTHETADASGAPVDDARIWLTWFEACDAIGLGPACRAEVAVRGDEAPELELLRMWHDRRRHDLEVDLEGEGLADAASGRLGTSTLPFAVQEHIAELSYSDPDAAAERARVWLDAHPDHPDVVTPVFAPDVPPRNTVGKLRKTIEKLQRKQLKRVDDPAVARRWHRLLLEMGSPNSSQWADRVVSSGGERPVDVRPMSRADQVKRAQAVMKGEAPLPTALGADREAVALKAAAMLDNAGRTRDAIDLLREAADGGPPLNVALAEVDLLLATNAAEEALGAAGRALQAAVGDWPTDPAGTRRTLRRIALSKALAARGAARLAAVQLEGAVVDLMIANQLAIEPERAGDLERAMEQARYTLETIKLGLDTPKTPAHMVALEQARAALAADDPSAAVQAATAAIQVLTLPTHRRARLTATLPSRPELASAFALRALAATDSDPLAARVDLMVATLLVPWTADPSWWSHLAELRGGEMALLAEAMAVHTSEAPAPPTTLHSVTGLPPTASTHAAIQAALVSDWMQGRPAEDEPTGFVITRGKVIPYVVRSRGGGGGGGGGASGGGGAVLNAPFPPFSLETDSGTVKLRKGRIHLITFARMDSPSSRRALNELTVLARKMKSTGLDVALIGVAIDKDQGAVSAVPDNERALWGAFGWQPELGDRFGVSAVPTTWIVDAQGIARFVHVGYLGPSAYEEGIRYISAR